MNSYPARSLTFTILSISLLTVMAGAAMAPALGTIADHFSDQDSLTVQLIVSLPALFIIITNLFFGRLCRLMDTRCIALSGLVLYVIAGAGAFFIKDIRLLLVFRAFLGISVGMLMPLSTGLLAFYYPPEEQGRLMGLAAAMNQMGGVVATFLAGFLANISWNCAFLVYLFGMIAIAAVAIFLPAEKLAAQSAGIQGRSLLKYHSLIIAMLLVITLFFIYPTNFAITTHSMTSLSGNAITIIMVSLDFVAFAIGLVFGKMMKNLRSAMKYIAPAGFLSGYLCLAFGTSVFWLVAGSVLIGIANGCGVPYINTIASIKGGKNATTAVMPLISASLYAGQFLSPLVVNPAARAIGTPAAPYVVGVAIATLYLLHTVLTRKSQ